MAAQYTLRLGNPVVTGGGFLDDITKVAKNWRRSTRWLGGYWQGSFSVEGKPTELQDWFFNRLGCHVEERSNGVVTWEGLIYEMELTLNGVKRRRSLDLMNNAVATEYVGYGGGQHTTPFETQTQSIARYGRKELVLSGPTGSSEPAVQMAVTELAANGWPWPRAVSVDVLGATRLSVSCVGYVYTANWRYVDDTQYDDGWHDITVNEFVHEILDDYCLDLLVKGNIAPNTLNRKKLIAGKTRAWDFLEELAALGDASGNRYHLWVGPGRRIHYGPVDTTPRYIMRQGGLYNTAGATVGLNPYLITPAVVRDLSFPVARSEPGSFLDDARDIFVEEVEVGANGSLSLRTALYTDADMFEAQANAQENYNRAVDNWWAQAWTADAIKREQEALRLETLKNAAQ